MNAVITQVIDNQKSKNTQEWECPTMKTWHSVHSVKASSGDS